MALAAAFVRDDGTPDEPGVHSDWNLWVAASRTYNFCCDDPLVDWLNLYGAEKGFAPDDAQPGYDERTNFRQFVIDRANAFEASVCDYLGRRYPCVRIRNTVADSRSRQAVEATWQAMANGTAIIAQGVLWNPQTRTYGAPDLLVRSDVLRELFPNDFSNDEAAIGAPDLGREDRHYRVVDIKFTTLDLLKNGSAGASQLKYMVQLWLYNEALGRLQGFTPPAAYLMGRKWETSRARGTSAVERLARVNRDHQLRTGVSLGDYSRSACDWIRRLRTEGRNWNVLPVPDVEQLWPNIRSDDQRWRRVKTDLVRTLEDLTLLPRVTPAVRNTARATGLNRWTEAACCAASLGISGPAHAAIVDGVIQTNHSAADGPIVFPARVTVNEHLWRTPVSAEFYVDFETVSDLDDDLSGFPRAGGQPLIFMIGCGHFSGPANNPEWTFSVFSVDSLTLAEERRVIEAWLAHMEQVCHQNGIELRRARLFHWSAAETSSLTEAYNAAQVRQGGPAWPDLPWCDLLNRVIKEQPVTVRGAFSFGLKAIAKALHQHGLIQTVWGDGPADGLGAMVGGWWCHREATRRGVLMRDIDLMDQIAAYNEIDCKVMAETLTYLRAHR